MSLRSVEKAEALNVSEGWKAELIFPAGNIVY
jgi:hypothetical protein